jgi:TAG lipase / steryl ester hydrolase / phospholipase A2 / LPA acyltransferase
MSFLQDSLFNTTQSLHSELQSGEQNSRKTSITPERRRSLRKAQSHAALLNPLNRVVRLAKHPRAVIDDVLQEWLPYGPKPSDKQRELVRAEEDRKQLLHLRLQNAVSFEDWRSAACELDGLEGNNTWKEEEESNEYDYVLVKNRLQQLDEARISCDVKRMLFLIRTSLTRGLGGMGDLKLYKHSHIGTKVLIERYIDSAQKIISALVDVECKQTDSGIATREVLEKILQTRQSFGRSALLLSGGGTFGMNHIGVVKCLWESKLLPRIISGASAGSIVCAVLCARTDNEIPTVLHEFCHGDLSVFEPEDGEGGVLTKAARFLKYGALFDISHLSRIMKNLLGDLTFQEAYNRTRRILNITVSSASLYELPRLLNYITAPNVIIWSAV